MNNVIDKGVIWLSIETFYPLGETKDLG